MPEMCSHTAVTSFSATHSHCQSCQHSSFQGTELNTDSSCYQLVSVYKQPDQETRTDRPAPRLRCADCRLRFILLASPTTSAHYAMLLPTVPDGRRGCSAYGAFTYPRHSSEKPRRADSAPLRCTSPTCSYSAKPNSPSETLHERVDLLELCWT
jgi:hypothetical protein